MVNKYIFEGKTKADAIDEAKNNLLKSEEDLLIKEIESKKNLFGKKNTKIEVIDKKDVMNFIKELLREIITNMGLNPKFELKKREDNFIIEIFSDNNAILIGKNGRTIDALQTIVRQAVYKEINEQFNFIIDVSGYKQKNQVRLEKLAKWTAKEVAQTKIEVKLDPMNSYERRIIHSVLSNSKDICTTSVGEEPNRCVIIKLKEE